MGGASENCTSFVLGKRLTEAPSDSKARGRAIKKFILQEEARIRQDMPFLRHQNFIGMVWFLASIAVILFTALSYLTGDLSAFWTIAIIGIPVSILHELEHDLIHNLYFKGKRNIQNVMFAFIWLFKFHANPWWRRDLHHWHHRVSGQSNDLEERLIGLGMQPGFDRLGVALHPGGFASQLPDIKRDAGSALDVRYLLEKNWWTAVPLGLILKAYPVLLACSYLLPEATFSAWGMSTLWPAVRDFMVLVVFPQILRQGCLHAMTTGSHYYGDIPAHDVFYQNQILDHWTLLPFHVYCWFFGATHIIHHYIPNQPFYMRSLISKNVHAFMIEQGVRKNDWGIIARANRWHIYEEHEKAAHTTAVWWFLSFLSAFAFVFVYDGFTVKPLLNAMSLARKEDRGIGVERIN